MRKLNLEFQDVDGNVLHNKILEIEESDKLIVQFPESMTLEQQCRIGEGIAKLLTNNEMNTAIIPHNATLSVLKIK
jgi:hypothetical protein